MIAEARIRDELSRTLSDPRLEISGAEFYQGKVRYYDDSGTIHEGEFVSVEDE